MYDLCRQTAFFARSVKHASPVVDVTLTLVSHNAPFSDPDDPSSVFVTPRITPDVKEGQDFLFRCLLTDPSVTNLTLQSEGSTWGRGQDLPHGMMVTLDPKIGALIRDLKRSFNGHYICSGWKDGRQFRSKPVHLLVAPGRTRLFTFRPVYLSVCLRFHVYFSPQ